jgi:hypothetical protein
MIPMLIYEMQDLSEGLKGFVRRQISAIMMIKAAVLSSARVLVKAVRSTMILVAPAQVEA